MSGLLAPNAPQPQPGFWRGLLDAFGQDAAAARAWFVSNMQRASGGGILGEGETDTGARAGAGMALGALGMTGAMPGGVFAAPRGAVMGAGPIRAFHGSPHDFDKFDIRKIGTGEGAQAYGHGLYFAENPAVARGYRNQLAKGFAGTDGAPLPRAMQQALEFVHPKFKETEDMRAGLEDAIRRMADQSEFYRKTYGDGWNIYDGALEKLRAVDPATIKPAGRMYEVAIHADPERFLDWDRPLAQQAPAVREALGLSVPNERALRARLGEIDAALKKGAADIPVNDFDAFFAPRPDLAALGVEASAIRQKLGTGVPPGHPLYGVPREALETMTGESVARPHSQYMAGRGESAVAAANVLRDAGIPGIRYLDAGSRGAKEGSRNYVVFDDNLIEILRKYGLLAPTVGVGGGLLATQDSQAAPR